MISIPAGLILDGIWRCGWVRAFIIVFPGGLEGLCFLWATQKHEVYLEGEGHALASWLRGWQGLLLYRSILSMYYWPG